MSEMFFPFKNAIDEGCLPLNNNDRSYVKVEKHVGEICLRRSAAKDLFIQTVFLTSLFLFKNI